MTALGGPAASNWSAVDAASDPYRLLTGLDALRAEPFFARSKARIAALIAETRATRVVDIGCGTGEDAVEVAGAGTTAIGIERSTIMCSEARARHARLPLIAGDALALPITPASIDAVRADRVIQHLPDAQAALNEWRRVLRPGGRLVCFDPDLTTAEVDGVDDRATAPILAWRLSTRPGATTVNGLPEALEAAGLTDIRVESPTLELTDLGRADGIMGLAGWGHAAADAHRVSRDDATHWSAAVHAASRDGRLRYRCSYILGVARAR